MDGGFIIVGYTLSYKQYLDMGLNLPVGYMIKTDFSGNRQWEKYYHHMFEADSSMDGDLTSVIQTSDGGFIACGRKLSSSGAGGYDVSLVRTDFLGNKQWEKNYGGSLHDSGQSVQHTSDGGFIIVGWTESYGAGQKDVYLIKTDSLGNKQWDTTFGGNQTDVGEELQITADGGFIIAGYTNSSGAGEGDVYLIKTDSLGNKQRESTIGGSLKDLGYSVCTSGNGEYIVAGFTYSFGAGKADVYLIKYLR